MPTTPAGTYFDQRPIQSVTLVGYPDGLPVASGGQTTVTGTVNVGNVVTTNDETTNPFDDGPAIHVSALYPGVVVGTPNGASLTINLLPANLTGNNFVSPNSPPSGLQVQGFPSLVDVRHVRLYIDNNGTTASISAVQLSSAQTVGNTTDTITYSPTGTVAILNNTGAFVDIPTPRGLNPALNGIFTCTSSTGTISIQPILYTQPQTAGLLRDRSGTITASGTSQQLAAANSARRFLMVENVSAGTIWVDFGVTAVMSQPSVQILTNGTLWMDTFVPTQAVNVIGSGLFAFTAKEA